MIQGSQALDRINLLMETQYNVISLLEVPQIYPWQALLIEEILDNVICTLSLKDIENLAKTCHNLHNLCQKIPSHRIHCLLKAWFSSSSLLAGILRDTGAIIAGSAILSILCPGNWLPGDLDFIISEQHTPKLLEFIKAEGYELTPEANQDYLPDGLIQFKRLCYQKKTPEGCLQVDLSVLLNPGNTPRDFIFQYHSSVVINYYDGKRLYCLYPTLTFNNILCRNRTRLHTPNMPITTTLLGIEKRIEKLVQKYVDRGFMEKQPENRMLQVTRWVYGYCTILRPTSIWSWNIVI